MTSSREGTPELGTAGGGGPGELGPSLVDSQQQSMGMMLENNDILLC